MLLATCEIVLCDFISLVTKGTNHSFVVSVVAISSKKLRNEILANLCNTQF